MQEKNAWERNFGQLANHTSVLLAPRFCPANPLGGGSWPSFFLSIARGSLPRYPPAR
jgi:hypothetical protein